MRRPAAAGGIQTEEQDETGVSLDYSEIDAALGKLGEDSNVSFSELLPGWSAAIWKFLWGQF